MCSPGRLCGGGRNWPIFSDDFEGHISTASCYPPRSCVAKRRSNRAIFRGELANSQGDLPIRISRLCLKQKVIDGEDTACHAFAVSMAGTFAMRGDRESMGPTAQTARTP